MLFRAATLEGIRTGTVTLAFRRWSRPTVRAGGTLRTAAGILAIESVDRVEAASEAEARRAGFANLAALMRNLETQRTAPLYRTAFRLAGPDPRAALRQQAEPGEDELARITDKLSRMDATAPWTLRTLHLIATREGVAAREIAEALEIDRDRLKGRIRRLKELGLTESLAVGYRLSPRGRAVLRSRPAT
ncbi:hypothetical protein EJV46_04450 [Roseococcus sp. SYP-B2431]|uniref:hypothetical protein n=1 Tax=Roseococcus sp. SYP-B2431 TaxID=2496640 RepID=UPI00103E30F7|nr:hypothetical protein [Roseococcus sp. SYP-B2431]TCH99917.1 hypothetical protein EJV46_04450 [Roseococcus sp. SYP-B2431]